MIKTIIFDLNGVIIEGGFRIREKLESEGFDRQKLHDSISGEGKYGGEFVRGEINEDEYKQKVKELFPNDYEYVISSYDNRDLTYVDREYFVDKIVKPFGIQINIENFGEKIKVLDIVHQLFLKYTLVLFTGSNPLNLKNLDLKYDFLKYFKYKVLSYEVGADKPSEKIFDALLKVIPNYALECLYFDDNAEYVDVARRIGLNAVVFNSLFN